MESEWLSGLNVTLSIRGGKKTGSHIVSSENSLTRYLNKMQNKGCFMLVPLINYYIKLAASHMRLEGVFGLNSVSTRFCA